MGQVTRTLGLGSAVIALLAVIAGAGCGGGGEECGNSQREGSEQCDLGPQNGQPGSTCSFACRIQQVQQGQCCRSTTTGQTGFCQQVCLNGQIGQGCTQDNTALPTNQCRAGVGQQQCFPGTQTPGCIPNQPAGQQCTPCNITGGQQCFPGTQTPGCIPNQPLGQQCTPCNITGGQQCFPGTQTPGCIPNQPLGQQCTPCGITGGQQCFPGTQTPGCIPNQPLGQQCTPCGIIGTGNIQPIVCGQKIQNSTLAGVVGGLPQSRFTRYSCGGDAQFGPENIYALQVPFNAEVTVDIDDPIGTDINFYVLADAPDPFRCIERGSNIDRFLANLGRTYYIVADSEDLDDAGIYEIDVSCSANTSCDLFAGCGGFGGLGGLFGF